MLTAAMLLLHLRSCGRRRSLAPSVLRLLLGLPLAFHHHVIGAAAAQPAHEIVRRLASQLDRGLNAEERRVRAEDDLGMTEQAAALVDGLDGKYIQRSASKYSIIDCA